MARICFLKFGMDQTTIMKKTILVSLTFLAIGLSASAQQSWNMTFHDNFKGPIDTARYNDVWGYVDSAGREYGIFGSNRETFFVEVTDPDSIRFIASFEGRTLNTTWRDYSTWSHYAFGVSDGGGGSLQIWDLQYLPDSVVKIFDHDSLGHSTHNIQMWRSDLYMIDNKGSNPGGGSYRWPVRVVSVKDPYNPKTVGGLFDTDYNLGHDVYIWHDTAYLSVYFSGTKNGLHVYDFRSPANPQLLGSLQNYPEAGINHASWGSWDRQTLVMADETHGSGVKMVDISDLSNMQTLSVFRTFPGAIAHNPFIVDTLAIISYYHDGVQVWSIKDPTNPVHVGYFDTDTTIGSGSNYGGYEGCWGVYPFFPSGTLIATDRDNGFFTLTLDGWVPPPPPPLPVGLNPAEQKALLNVYPNPSNGRITVSLGEQVDMVLRMDVMSMDGKVVYSRRIEGKFGIYDFDLSGISESLYLIRVHGDGFEKRARLILK